MLICMLVGLFSRYVSLTVSLSVSLVDGVLLAATRIDLLAYIRTGFEPTQMDFHWHKWINTSY